MRNSETCCSSSTIPLKNLDITRCVPSGIPKYLHKSKNYDAWDVLFSTWVGTTYRVISSWCESSLLMKPGVITLNPVQNCPACTRNTLHYHIQRNSKVKHWQKNSCSLCSLTVVGHCCWNSKAAMKPAFELSQSVTVTLQSIQEAIKNKCCGLLTSGVILLLLILTCMLLRFKWKKLQNLPCSLDLSPWDFHVFGPLRKALKGQSFHSYVKVKTAILQWFHNQPPEFFLEGIQHLVTQWDKCLNAGGDFL